MTSFAPFSSHWPRFITLLNERTGLQVREKDRAGVMAALESRRKALGINRPEQYLELLENSRDEGEWRNLLPLLTNGESYFLRDARQFSLLRHTIIPELMERRAQKRALRIWSAGCSTGEEVYSLAMLIDELAPPHQGWQTSVLGTDINEAALARARAGVYNQWSFRGVSEEVRRSYFQKVGASWKVNDRLRSLVDFRALNLRGAGYPDRATGLSDIDLILCRNVLIYLSPDAVAHALRQFTATLQEGGFLLTGHAELAHHTMSLQVRIFPESVAYQKLGHGEAKFEEAKPKEVRPLRTLDERPTISGRAQGTPRPPLSLSRNRTAFPQRPLPSQSSSASLAQNQQPSQNQTQDIPQEGMGQTDVGHVASLCSLAQREANLGRHAEAIAALREATSIDSTYADAYALWAQVVSEQGDNEEAKRLWKKVVFLAPTRADAWLDLGELYAATGDATRARKMRQTALEILQSTQKDAIVYHGTTVKAAELAEHVKGLLATT